MKTRWLWTAWLMISPLLIGGCQTTPVAASCPAQASAPASLCNPAALKASAVLSSPASTPTNWTKEYEQTLIDFNNDLRSSLKAAERPSPVSPSGGSGPAK